MKIIIGMFGCPLDASWLKLSLCHTGMCSQYWSGMIERSSGVSWRGEYNALQTWFCFVAQMKASWLTEVPRGSYYWLKLSPSFVEIGCPLVCEVLQRPEMFLLWCHFVFVFQPFFVFHFVGLLTDSYSDRCLPKRAPYSLGVNYEIN